MIYRDLVFSVRLITHDQSTLIITGLEFGRGIRDGLRMQESLQGPKIANQIFKRTRKEPRAA